MAAGIGNRHAVCYSCRMRLPPVHHRSVLITGCSTGIGLATAHLLRDHGWRVVTSARKPADVEKLRGAGFESLTLDLADETSVSAATAETLRLTDGQLGALINNAGFGQAGAMEDISRATLRYQFEVNVFGAQDLANRLLPAMMHAGAGRIVHISSVLGRLTLPLYGSYCASKHALEALADAQRLEVRGLGVGVILVEPGPIATEFRRNAAQQVEAQLDMAGAAYRDYYRKEVERRRNSAKPSSRFAAPPEAVAQVIERALESRNPRARYAVTLPAQVGPILRKLMPDALWDAVLGSRVPPRNPPH